MRILTGSRPSLALYIKAPGSATALVNPREAQSAPLPPSARQMRAVARPWVRIGTHQLPLPSRLPLSPGPKYLPIRFGQLRLAQRSELLGRRVPVTLEGQGGIMQTVY